MRDALQLTKETGAVCIGRPSSRPEDRVQTAGRLCRRSYLTLALLALLGHQNLGGERQIDRSVIRVIIDRRCSPSRAYQAKRRPIIWN